MQIDHVTIAGPNLPELQRRFADVGLPADYGGVHANGVTHMALLGFDDGSYLELISTITSGADSPWWSKQIAADGGLCAWCARTDDITEECERLRFLGVAVRGPIPFDRLRPDGTRVEWDLGFVGEGEPGAVLPFLIQDRTPRDWRVRSSPALSGTGLSGIAGVVIGVRDLVRTIGLIKQVYRWDTRETHVDPAFGATVVTFTGTPLALAAPLSRDSWLATRLAQLGDSPAALLLRGADLPASARRFAAGRAGWWLGRPAVWFNHEQIGGVRLGIIEEVA